MNPDCFKALRFGDIVTVWCMKGGTLCYSHEKLWFHHLERFLVTNDWTFKSNVTFRSMDRIKETYIYVSLDRNIAYHSVEKKQ